MHQQVMICLHRFYLVNYLQIHPSSHTKRTLVIGLASGVTAYEAYKSGGKPLTIVELEPAIVEAATYFRSVNESILNNLMWKPE